jgi:hypothetical protein
MKKSVSKKPLVEQNGFQKLEKQIDTLARIMMDNFTRIEKTMATKADILDLHDKFIHRREFDQLSLRFSKLEEKMRR